MEDSFLVHHFLKVGNLSINSNWFFRIFLVIFWVDLRWLEICSSLSELFQYQFFFLCLPIMVLDILLSFSSECLLLIPLLVLWCFQGNQKGTFGINGLKKFPKTLINMYSVSINQPIIQSAIIKSLWSRILSI